ncbi:MAG: cysteine desulfurase-like protein [Anaerolineae bacterium]|nr:cysteine desulfurase-like protein [Anaerolineae bacterium]
MLDVTAVRRKFPALMQVVSSTRPVYLDNPGGTQVPGSVIEAMKDYLITANSNHMGAFLTSRLTDQTILDARVAMADLLNAPGPQNIVFGHNMTTLTLHFSRSIGLTLSRGDEIVLTRMDHDANISPWLLMARDHDLTVRWVDWDTETGRLNMAQMADLIGSKTKLVACTYASNALGTINDVAKVVEMAHTAGALAYIDAVHYAPHGPIDVQALDCDFLVCSAYKFFGPHVGVLYAQREHLESLPAYKVRPAPDAIPERWETGTQNHEGLAGVRAAIDYLAWVGEQFGEPCTTPAEGHHERRCRLKAAMSAMQDYERGLSKHLLEGLSEIGKVTPAGITDIDYLEERTPTVVFNIEGKTPLQVAAELDKAGIYVWDGNYYALEVMQALGREEHGGMVRVGAAHYNTHDEIDRFLDEVRKIARA